MVKPVPAKHLKRPPAVKSRKQRGAGAKQQSGEPGRNQIDQIVQFSRRPAQFPVAVIFIAHHGIHCVHRFVEIAAHRSQKSYVKHRGDHAVGGVFRHRLHRSPQDAAAVQRRGVPAHNHGNVSPGLLHVVLLHGMADLHALCAQVLSGQKLVTHQTLRRQQKTRARPPRQMQRKPAQGRQKQPGNHSPEAAHEDRQKQPRGSLPARKPRPQQALQPGDHPSHQPHRVRQPAWVAKQPVQRAAPQQGASMKYKQSKPT